MIERLGPKRGRLAAFGVAGSILLAVNEVPGWRVALVVVVATVAIASRQASWFWTQVAHGVVGGALAGLVILGPGWRVAMRLVAASDPHTNPEFSLGGTALVIGIGALIGGIMGIAGNLVRHAARIRSPFVSGIAVGVLTTGSLALRFRSDLTSLGSGVWVNLVLFGTIAIVYGVVAMLAVEGLAARMTRRRTPIDALINSPC